MYQPLSDIQAKAEVDVVQTYYALQDAEAKLRSNYQGGMHWKTVAGREYLYRTLDGKGNAKSLGVRAVETEAQCQNFTEKKQALQQRIRSLSDRLSERARVAKALRVGSAPRLLADICERLSRADLMGNNLLIVGTNALYAYESLAGVRFDSEMTATVDIDLLWKNQSKLSAIARNISEEGLLGLLRRVDKSFALIERQRFRAVNDDGFMVDLIRPMPNPPWQTAPQQFGLVEDLQAVDIPNIKWLIAAPRLRQVVLSHTGKPFIMEVPDPRAFMLYKTWLAQQADREPIKKHRDARQAQLLLDLLENQLPHYPLDTAQLRFFPESIRQMVKAKYLNGSGPN